jgi:hypothetical protein
MTASIQGIARIYGLLLRLFPRDFKKEFREEMEDVFSASLEEAAKTSVTLVVQACFFELFDLPGNLVIEHLSNLRKGKVMKTKSFEVGRSRAVLMAALGMLVGWELINWVLFNWLYRQDFWKYPENRLWMFYVVSAIEFTLPVILCGLMLGIAAGLGRRAFVRIGLWTAAGGILGYLVNIPVNNVFWNIYIRTAYLPSLETKWIDLVSMLAVMCIYGIFTGAGLGFAFGGWKTGLKFALIGLVAFAVGNLAGYFMFSSGLAYRVPLGPHGASYLVDGIQGVLAGGILGWFFGSKRQPEAGPLIGKSTA